MQVTLRLLWRRSEGNYHERKGKKEENKKKKKMQEGKEPVAGGRVMKTKAARVAFC